jgi:hypothetical protein
MRLKWQSGGKGSGVRFADGTSYEFKIQLITRCSRFGSQYVLFRRLLHSETNSLEFGPWEQVDVFTRFAEVRAFAQDIEDESVTRPNSVETHGFEPAYKAHGAGRVPVDACGRVTYEGDVGSFCGLPAGHPAHADSAPKSGAER